MVKEIWRWLTVPVRAWTWHPHKLLCGLHPCLLKEETRKSGACWFPVYLENKVKQTCKQATMNPRFRERPCLKWVESVRILRELVAFFWSLPKQLFYFSVSPWLER